MKIISHSVAELTDLFKSSGLGGGGGALSMHMSGEGPTGRKKEELY